MYIIDTVDHNVTMPDTILIVDMPYVVSIIYVYLLRSIYKV